MPPSACSNFPLRRSDGARERAPLVPEELGLEEGFGERRAGHGDEGLVGPVARRVDRPRDHLLAGAALPLDEHRAPQLRDVPYEIEDLVHRRALARHLVERVLLLQLPAEQDVLALQVLDPEDALDEKREFVRVAGLDDVLLRTLLHGLDGRVHRRVGSDDDDRGIGVELPKLAHRLEPVHAGGHLQIHEVDREVLLFGLLDRLATRGCRLDRVAVLVQPDGDGLALDRLVVHDEDLPLPIHDPASSPTGGPDASKSSRTVNVVPRPTSLWTFRRPPCASTMP